jgi:hypothetical protein
VKRERADREMRKAGSGEESGNRGPSLTVTVGNYNSKVVK